MMSFGWRPTMSCYAGSGKVRTSTQQAVETAAAAVSTGQASPDQHALIQAAAAGDVTITTCPSPTWFYALLTIAAFTGIMKGKKR